MENFVELNKGVHFPPKVVKCVSKRAGRLYGTEGPAWTGALRGDQNWLHRQRDIWSTFKVSTQFARPVRGICH